MLKTTVYLPIDLKAELQRTAAETGRSEADLIREGIRLAVTRRTPPLPSFGMFDSGDPDLCQRVDDILAEGFGRD